VFIKSYAQPVDKTVYNLFIYIRITIFINLLLSKNLILCNDATYSESSKTGDPTEIALLEAGVNYNIFKDELEKSHQRIDEVPFDSDRKLMTTVNKYDDEYYVMTKGAIDNLLTLCTKAYIKGNIVEITQSIKDEIFAFADAVEDIPFNTSSNNVICCKSIFEKIIAGRISIAKRCKSESFWHSFTLR